MKTPSTTEAMPSAHNSANSTDDRSSRPLLQAGPEVTVPSIFGMSLSEIEQILESAGCLPSLDDDDQWDPYDPSHHGRRLAKKLGFPCDPKKHEQPYQVARLWSLPIRSYQSDCELEIIVNRGLRVIWEVRSEQLADTLPPDEALRQLQQIGDKLVHYFGSNNRVWRECQADQVKEWATWLICTHGCYDLASGHLTDDGREIAALREFNMTGGAS